MSLGAALYYMVLKCVIENRTTNFVKFAPELDLSFTRFVNPLNEHGEISVSALASNSGRLAICSRLQDRLS